MVLWLPVLPLPYIFPIYPLPSNVLLTSSLSATASVPPASSIHSAHSLLAVRLKPSKRLAVILSLAHFTAIGLLWPLALPVTVKFAGSVLLAGSLVLYVRYFALLTSSGSVRSLKLGLDAADVMICMIETGRGDHMACALLGSSFVAPYLTILELKPLGFQNFWQRFSHRSVVILPDGIDEEEFRQLRVLLRWKWKEPGVLD